MTQREKDLFYEVLELLRKEVRTSSDFRNRDWKDADDYIFSALHLTQGDIAEIYSGRRGLVYDKSAIEGFYPVCPSYAELLRLHAAYAVGSVTLECELYKSNICSYRRKAYNYKERCNTDICNRSESLRRNCTDK